MRAARVVVGLVVSAFVLSACSEEPPATPAPEPTSEPAPPPPPPEAPALATIDAPEPGHAEVAYPTWDASVGHFTFAVRDLPAAFGRHERVTRLVLGADEQLVSLKWLGEALDVGEHRVLPDDSASRSEHLGQDARVFLASVAHEGGALPSVAGSVTVTSVADGAVEGTFDFSLEARRQQTETRTRGRFHARLDAQVSGELAHNEDIRQDLLRRAKRRR